MFCVSSRFSISQFAAVEGLWKVDRLFAVLPQRDELVQYAIVFCSLCVLVQLGVVWGTKWGDRNLFLKSFVLSLFLHFCFVMNWYSFSQVGKAASPDADEEIDQPKTESIAIQIRTEPVQVDDVTEEPDVAMRNRLPLGTKRTAPQTDAQRIRGDYSALLERSELPEASRREAPLPVPVAEVPMVRSAIEETVTTELQNIAAPQMIQPAESALPLVTDDTPPADATNNEGQSRPQVPVARRRNLQRTVDQSDVTNQPETPNRVRQPSSGKSKRGRMNDESAVDPLIVKNEATRMLANPDVEIPIVRVTPPVEEIKKQPAKATFIASGVVTNAMTGKPIAGATIRVDQISSPSLKTKTASDGTYRITLSDLPDNFAITASLEEYIPMSKNLSRGERNGMTPQTDFQLQPLAPTVVVVEENPEVHHVGDDRFEGRVNSQFQRKSEGESVTLRFRISQNEQQLQQVRGVVRFLAKGIQCPPDIRINRTMVSNSKRLSAEDGSFGPFEIRFDTALLRQGNNSIEVRSTQCTADLDDFEFVNVQIRLEPKE